MQKEITAANINTSISAKSLTIEIIGKVAAQRAVTLCDAFLGSILSLSFPPHAFASAVR